MNDAIDAKHALLLGRAGDTPAAQLVMALLTTTRRIDTACAALLAEHGLTEGRLAALLAVDARPASTPAQVADALGVTRATVTGLTEGLVAPGYLVRRADGQDRRSVTLHVTEAGEALLATVTPLYTVWLAELTAGLDAAQHAATIATLTTVQRNLGPSDV